MSRLLRPTSSLLCRLQPSPIRSLATVSAPRLPADLSISSKVILITGGGRGLGLTQGEALAAAGATVYALDVHSAAPTEFTRAASLLPAGGGQLHYLPLDVRDNLALTAAVRGVADAEGRIDGLIAAAGVLEEVDALRCTKEQFDRIMGINVTGVFLSAQACAREMVRLAEQRGEEKAGGSIVLVASMSGVVANRGVPMAAYNTSKSAVHQLSRNLAAEWGVPHGIRVNTLSPGYIATKMVENLFERYPERRQLWSQQNMLGRISSPDEYKGVAVFLMSEASSFMTGADLMVDGGHRAW
ncbi:hypothetical protein BZA05DRAFT_448722 [Tricharina praecox]|uniref:uncharacterized protein n=1 Tax=Tricharina praecox TaxID=43433 RepID=UPI00221E9C8F|nr:uncharacterized protein BZA05DRAFT_448722 [Tricharina praecox]KAI5843592.1 hypothetical protein BZA05DRAFT_448722 [Tricharina praecox]